MVTLIILDGWGLSKNKFGNAIVSAGTPNLDKLKKRYAYTTLKASGEAVGLPKGQMGNSEVGHLTLGAGRTIFQDLVKIDKEIENGNFFKNPQILKAISHAKENSSALHIMGLISDGGVHSHINHLLALIKMAKENEVPKVYIHGFLDGRDTLYNSGTKYVDLIEKHLEGTPYKIASLSGRIYAMDREKRYERLEKAYKTLVYGDNFTTLSPKEAIKKSYEEGIYDEFFLPQFFDKDGIIKDNDSVIFFNFRSDRAKELTSAFTDNNFNFFKTKAFKNLLFSPMEEYGEEFRSLNTIYPPERVEDNLSAILSQNGLKQFHIAETTKYAHVTFFFNGGIEKPYEGEARELIESIDTQDFSFYPKMKAYEITEKTLEAIASNKYDFILVNFSNPDMIGHTGNFNATKEAISCVDKNAYALALATLMAGGECIITADHGNAEKMIDNEGNKLTSHTTNPVPLYFVSEKRCPHLRKGTLACVAPTILKMLNLSIPSSMEKPLF